MDARAAPPHAEFLELSVESIEINPKSKEVTLQVVLRNNTSADCVRVSGFSLDTVIRNGLFHDTNGHVWILLDPERFIDPPPLKVDYSTKLRSGDVRRISFTFEGISVLRPKEKKDATAVESGVPTTLTYYFFGEVDTANCNYAAYRVLVAGGRGRVKMTVRDADRRTRK